MADRLCNQFDTLRKLFQDELEESGKYKFQKGTFNKYCPNRECSADTDIVNAGCLWLFNAFFGTSGTSHYHDVYKDVAVCIMIWLSYKLSLKPPEKITTLKEFYSNYIENNTEYINHKSEDSDYESHKKVIDEIKGYMDINISHMAKFDELLKLLCNMNTSYTKGNSNDFSKHANNFVNKYNELLNDDNNHDDSSYSKVLLVLSNYYSNFEKSRAIHNTQMKFSPLPTQKTPKKDNSEGPEVTKATKGTEMSSEEDKSDIETIQSYDTILSDSSLVNKLVIVLPILAAIAIFLGISYKYSLFGFRKRSQKQKLRKKLKK
ncbi:PIR protein [Plasmodium yoelii]|uniref:PIR protein n=2 Tax=Plasmodium yoelii TaxID=5861 RepID=A0AAE9WJH7_PLAYO|nr:PIR protein [Plasmodium yoelii]WBY54581.1 PIR protein [Plasmodium yoelii yoelii]CDU15980.1 YIR protein [Plasmodium yoelii]VTZ71575.1 PIR protein [Plasmodium yoelii]|eukprot:XP_022811282.1 PIR protein [Plasmodium yoelii]